MKVLCSFVVLLSLGAGGADQTAWYDASGEVVLVEDANAIPAESGFVAEWRKRELERRERYGGPWTSEIQPVWSGGYPSRSNYYYRGYRRKGRGYHAGRSYYGGYYRSCPVYRSGGATVIIRW